MARWFVTVAAFASLILTGPTIHAQSPVTVQIVAMLVDSELSVRAVPRHALTIASSGGASQRVVTGLDGKVQLQLPAGKYTIESERPVDFQGKSYRWSLPIAVTGPTTQILELSTDNAVVELTAGSDSGRSNLPALFKRWQNSVVTVWSDTRHGSGFVIDKRGLIVTNQHVVGVSGYIAVQFSEDLKVPAFVLVKSQEKDVAILRVHPKYVADIEPVALGYAQGATPPAVEGEPVFAIGSPLNQRRVLTSGIVSKVEPRAIISDVNINPGNSGGPLFTMNSVVIGINTFGDATSRGPGISGIVRIDEAREEIRKAELVLKGEPPPDRALPVEPSIAYPLDSLKELVTSRPVKLADYEFGTGNFDVSLMTPVLTYGVQYQIEQEALRERNKRNRKAESVRGTTESFQGFRNWAEYVGAFRPVVMIDATPKLVEGFWSSLSRGLAASQGMVSGPAQVHFKNDFYQMKLMCGAKEVAPIHPGKVEYRVAARNAAVNVNDVSYGGMYVYGPDAVGPHCGEVTLSFYTEKEPEKADVRTLSSKLVNRIWDDFAAYRAVAGRKDPAPSPRNAEPMPATAPAISRAPASTPPAPTTAPATPAAASAPATSPRPAAPFAGLARSGQATQAAQAPQAPATTTAPAASTPQSPDGADALRRARQYDALGRRADAITWYERAVQNLPDSDPGKKIAADRLVVLKGLEGQK